MMMAVLTEMLDTAKGLVKDRIFHMRQTRKAILDEFLKPVQGRLVVFALVRPFAELVADYEAVCFPQHPTYRNTVYADIAAMTETNFLSQPSHRGTYRSSEKDKHYIH